nr:hypothetical protein [Tanacetum cinerariifolium]
MSNSYTNESFIYDVSNKRAKLDFDSALLWHCRLGHISKKRIEKLQHDGLIDSSDLRAFEKCVSCMSGKMARKPYTHQVERAKDLLGLIHTDHKHEVFETFKVFQKEVENQLGKTIKSLRSDRDGQYMSQEFLDHLKDYGIIAHRTPPYTSQHNGVSKRRNKTLLDIVRSMTSQTTLPKSFWDYALETAARILNMVPTKKVEKTPYEVWHGKTPKLYYLKVWGCEELVKRDTLTKPNKNAEFLENSLINQEASGSLEDLEIIQEEDTHPSIDTSLNHEEDDLEIDEPQSDIVPIRRSIRTRHAPDRVCLYIDAEEHELGDLGKPANYKAALLDPEYIAAFDASKEAVWLRKFIFRLGVIPIIEEHISMYCDNTRAIAIANESGITKGARHFHVKVHYLREVIEYGDIKLEKVHTDDNLADPFTKALAFPKHLEHTRNIGMFPASSLM